MKRATPITAIAVSRAKPIAKPIRSLLASDGFNLPAPREYACAAMGDEATGHGDGSAAVPDGIDAAGLERWFGENVPEAELPLAFERIAGGLSNLTYRVGDAADPRRGARPPPPSAGGSAPPTTWAASPASSPPSVPPTCRWRRCGGSARTRLSPARPS